MRLVLLVWCIILFASFLWTKPQIIFFAAPPPDHQLFFYIEILSGFFTASVGQNLFIDTDGDMCQLRFGNLFLFSSSAVPAFCKVLYASGLSWARVCVCVCVFFFTPDLFIQDRSVSSQSNQNDSATSVG